MTVAAIAAMLGGRCGFTAAGGTDFGMDAGPEVAPPCEADGGKVGPGSADDENPGTGAGYAGNTGKGSTMVDDAEPGNRGREAV